jgi:divalent metal cation (Fe/Co/Zn/Cd) transporter
MFYGIAGFIAGFLIAFLVFKSQLKLCWKTSKALKELLDEKMKEAHIEKHRAF